MAVAIANRRCGFSTDLRPAARILVTPAPYAGTGRVHSMVLPLWAVPCCLIEKCYRQDLRVWNPAELPPVAASADPAGIVASANARRNRPFRKRRAGVGRRAAGQNAHTVTMAGAAMSAGGERAASPEVIVAATGP